jgi:hypothetical protein
MPQSTCWYQLWVYSVLFSVCLLFIHHMFFECLPYFRHGAKYGNMMINEAARIPAGCKVGPGPRSSHWLKDQKLQNLKHVLRTLMDLSFNALNFHKPGCSVTESKKSDWNIGWPRSMEGHSCFLLLQEAEGAWLFMVELDSCRIR